MKLAPIVVNHLPNSIQQNNELFTQFISDYYAFMEKDVGSPQDILQNILSIIETDAEHEEFFYTVFNKIYPDGIPSTVATDPKLFPLAMQQLYKTKGSETSYKILFRILFGVVIEIFYPKFRMIRSSDGKWNQDQSILVSISGDIREIENRFLNCTNKTGSIKTKIIRYNKITESIYEIFIGPLNQNANFSFNDLITVPGTQFSGLVQKTITKCTVKNSGSGFREGQIYNIKDDLGSGSSIKIKKVNADGGILVVSIISFGLGFTQPFYSTINSPVTLTSSTNPFTTFTNGFIETGLITNQNGTVLRKFYNDSSIVEGGQIDTTKSAVLSIEIGSLCKYSGYYSVSDGMVSDYGVIQDGKLFQEYSYLINSEVPVDQYRDAVQTILHPAGTLMFGEYSILNNIDLGVALELVRDIVRALTVTDDFSTPSDSYSIASVKGLDEDVPPTDLVAMSYEKNVPNDDVLNSDSGNISRSDYVESGYMNSDYVSNVALTF